MDEHAVRREEYYGWRSVSRLKCPCPVILQISASSEIACWKTLVTITIILTGTAELSDLL